MTHQKMRPLPTASERPCTKCGETKPLDEFYRMKSGTYGRESHCKVCSNARKRDLRRRNPEYRERCCARNREYSKAKYHGDAEFREKTLQRTRANHRKRREDPEKLAQDRERGRLYSAWRYHNDPEFRERRYRYNREKVAAQSSRVRRIRKLLDHFEGRDAYLDYIAHATNQRSDAASLSWLCSRIDTLIAERVYGEV